MANGCALRRGLRVYDSRDSGVMRSTGFCVVLASLRSVSSVSQRTGGCFSGLPNKQTLSPLW